jgi:hypothetical protein
VGEKMKIIQLLSGKKTYIMAGLTVVWALVGLFLGKIDPNTFINYLLAAGTVVGFRSALNK